MGFLLSGSRKKKSKLLLSSTAKILVRLFDQPSAFVHRNFVNMGNKIPFLEVNTKQIITLHFSQ